MELFQGNSAGDLVELEIGTSKESVGRFFDSQRELFHSQIDQLRKIVVAQCKLTGVNPLSQEMAAGALSIKIGKKPRDLLNPKATKYMQAVFSIKDSISKKETREISALCGVTISQVREFFSSQRSRVRKLVRLSRDKAIKSNMCTTSSNGCSSNFDHSLPVNKHAPENSVDLMTVEEQTQVPIISGQLNIVQERNKALVDTADKKTLREGPSCSLQEETIPGVDSDDKIFLVNIFSLMRKEETFSGQVKLMEWVLQIHNSAVLHWFLSRGGIMILAAWLSEAALEEQATVLLVIFKVLCHLPLHKALPVQMSAILQTVNKLRFYRTSDISNKARVLLSRWSKLFVRSQALKRPSSMYSSSEKEIIRKQRINGILSDELWQSKVDIPEDILALGYQDSENSRKLEPKRALKLLPASCDDSNKKHRRTVSSPKTKERRKVLLVEQPDRKTTGRNVPAARAVSANNSRPISADDIQKAKMRAIFMQNKYGKIDTSANKNHSQKTDYQKMCTVSQTRSILPTSKLPQLERDEDNKPVAPTETCQAMLETLIDTMPSSTSQEPLLEKLKSDQVPWQTPPEMSINCLWKIGTGENSKEVDFQSTRIRRERETFYLNVHGIPSNPKEAWDVEMDFDDSLTPEIPTEQPPTADILDAAEASLYSPHDNKNYTDESAITSAPSVSGVAPEPDLELLAVLLKNPDLVFALTSGQGSSLSNAETVALLDMLKKSSNGLAGILNGSVAGTSSQKAEPTSLPSPTPTSELTRTGWWRTETSPLSKNSSVATILPAAPPSPTPISLPGKIPTPTTILSVPKLTVTLNPRSPVIHILPNKTEVILPTKQHFPVTRAPISASSLQQETFNFEQMHSHNPPPLSALPWIPPMSQPVLLPEPPIFPHVSLRWPPSAVSVEREPVPGSWISRSTDLLETEAPNNYHTPTNQNDFNIFPVGPGRTQPVLPGLMAERNGLLGRSELETWSPEGSHPEFRLVQNIQELRKDRGRNEWSRQHNSGHRDRQRSGRRWCDRDRDYDSDRFLDRDYDRGRCRDRDCHCHRGRDRDRDRRR